MSERGKRVLGVLGQGVLVLIMAAFFGWLGFLQWSMPSNRTPEVSGPHVARGMFTVSTTGANTTGPYPFQGDDGRAYDFYCDRIRGGRGPDFNICLHPARGNPAGELGGRPLEVRYLALRYPKTWLGPSSPHLVILSVRENGRVLFRNTLWIRTAS